MALGRSISWRFAVVVSIVLTSGSLMSAAFGKARSEQAPAFAPTAGQRRASRAAETGPIRRSELLGRSAGDRPIKVWELGARSGAPVVLVVGCIHGDEPAGIEVARDLIADAPPRHITLWVVPDLNPDGVAADTRLNGRGVDLNRNFPYRWRPIGRRGDLHYSGRHALSERESRISRSLILQVRPDVTIWFHQQANLVDKSGGRLAVERRYARLTQMRLVRLPRYPGSATGWQNHRLPGSTAFVVELPAGRLRRRGVERFSDAVVRLIR